MTLYTEKEAREKVCHQAKLFNASNTQIGDCRCIASACMAWEWLSDDEIVLSKARDYYTRHTGRTLDGDPIMKDGRGFCGLAGRPE